MNETNNLQNEIMNNNIINMNEKNYYNIIPNDNYERLNEFKNNIGYGNYNFNNNNNYNYIQKMNSNFNVAKTPEQNGSGVSKNLRRADDDIICFSSYSCTGATRRRC